MVTTKKATAASTEAAAKRAVVKPAATKSAAQKLPAAAPLPAKDAVSKRKTAAKVAAADTVTTAPAKRVVTKKKTASPKPVISEEQRKHYVEVAAFYIAERRGFAAADPQDDWIAAEAEIDRLIASGNFAA